MYDPSMKIGIVQLGDIHIKTATDGVLGRGKSIVATALGTIPNVDIYVLALTGDFANSGLADEYTLARGLIASIQEAFARASRRIVIALTPGNHDLDFRIEPDTRPLLLESLHSKINALDHQGAVVTELVSIQKAYFDFEADILGERRGPNEYLVRSESFTIDSKLVRIISYNTAWVSTIPERPGQLLFPIETANVSAEPADLTISLLHHPYNWMLPENARSFRNAVESTSDVVLTGHEHVSDTYGRIRDDTGVVQYVEGAVLQERGTEQSAFNVLLIDTDARTFETFVCDWQRDGYVASSLGSREFVRNKLLGKSQYHISETFIEKLNDPSLPISHPRRHDVQLDDLYIYPTLTCRDPNQPTITPRIIYSNDVVEHMREPGHVLIVGDDTVGKSSFAKKLFRDLHSDGTLVPLLLRGGDFEGFSDKDIDGSFEIRRPINTTNLQSSGISDSNRDSGSPLSTIGKRRDTTRPGGPKLSGI